MKKFIYLSFVILFSCSESSNLKYYSSGNIKRVDLINQNKQDSSVYYYDSSNSPISKIVNKTEKKLFHIINYSIAGQKLSEGYRNKDSIRIGKWFFYRNDTIEIREYKNIRGNEYLNQSWIKTSSGDTLKGNYVLLKKIKDTVEVNELVSFRFYLEGFLFSKDSELILVLPEYGKNFNEDFSNEFELKKDTIDNLKYDSLNKHLKHLPLNHILISNLKFTTPGKKHLRGILKEMYYPDNDTVELLERNIYFEKEMYVKDTVN